MIDAYKRAAMTIYGLAESDRQWLLDRLDPEQRRTVTLLLAELEELKPDAESLRSIEADVERTSQPAAPWPARAPDYLPADVVSEIDAAPAALMSRILSEEPAWMAALLLDLHAWSWARVAIDSQPAQWRMSLQRVQGAQQHIKRRIGEAVARSLAERIRNLQKRNGSAFDQALHDTHGDHIVAGRRFWRGLIKWLP